MTPISPDKTILLAKLRHVEELERLSICTGFVETIGLMIHQIQAERGASCLYLASDGKRLGKERSEIIAYNLTVEEAFKSALHRHLNDTATVDAKQLTLISWILLGLEQLKSFRHQVTLFEISFPDCIQSYTRLIGSLISLIFEITDSAVNSQISTYLVALYNLVQGKEFAGQERAVGAFMFGSGYVQREHQQKLLGLVELQERHFELFCQFATDGLQDTWNAFKTSPIALQQQRYRTKLAQAEDQQALVTTDSDAWFEICSQRLTAIWQLQCQLIGNMHQSLDALSASAKQDLEKTRSYLHDLSHKPVPSKDMDSTFFNLSIPIENAFTFLAHDNINPYPMESIITLLQQQSQQIAEIENELSETKKALAERKQIERAKGLMMHKLGLSEVEAYKVMRSTAMEQNRKIIDVAENILAHTKINH